MANSVTRFLAEATADNIRVTNQFEVEAVSGYPDVDAVLEGVMLFGTSISIPTRGVEYATVSYKGFDIPNLVPTKLTMEQEHSVKFYEDVNGTHRRAFLRWMNHVVNADIAGGSVFEGDRGVNDKATLRIRLFDKDNKTVSQTYKFYNVVVSDVGSISLDYSGGDAATFEVKFKSSWWEIEEANYGSLTDQK